MAAEFHFMSSLIFSLVPSLLLIVGWVLQKEVVALLLIETPQHTLWSSSRSSSGYRSIHSCRFDNRDRKRFGRCKFCRQNRLSLSSSPRENPIDEFDTLETLSNLLVDLLPANETHASATTESVSLRYRQRQQEILTTRLSDVHCSDIDSKYINVNRTYVGTSTIGGAGSGLFARRDYPKGTLLTCYPGDALVELTNDNNGVQSVSERGRVQCGSHAMKVAGAIHYEDDSICDSGRNLDPIDDLVYPLRQEYMLRAIHDHWGIVAVPELFGDDDPTYLGHFANDGALYPPTCESELAAYVIESTDKANAMHQPCKDCHMVTVATRDLKAGEEIYVTYGPDYWREQASFVPSLQHNDDDEGYDSNYFDDYEDLDLDDDLFSEDEKESNETEIFFLSDETSDSQGKGFG